MDKKLFGTDGIRGHIEKPYLSPESMAKLGRVLGRLIKEKQLGLNNAEPTVLLGRDTRDSGIYLEHALVSGIIASGVNCALVGVIPTAGVSYLTRITNSNLGIMISASHNPAHDNGIKIFNNHGFKIDKSLESLIENYYHSEISYSASSQGRILNSNNLKNNYLSSLLELARVEDFSGMRIVIDCAHGAAYELAANVFSKLSCETIFIGVAPDGTNINKNFGSEHPTQLKREVLSQHAQLGIAYDGDADRVIFVDEKGEIINGEAVLAIFALDLKKKGELKNDSMVTTVMSSVALDKLLYEFGIRVMRTEVGDKFVVEEMQKKDISLGGENSGHLIMPPSLTSSDGILSSLIFLSILKKSNKSASELAHIYTPSPKIVENISVADKIPLAHLPKTREAIIKANDSLRNQGRVFFRYSGTENKARLLVEAPTEEQCLKIIREIRSQFTEEMALVA